MKTSERIYNREHGMLPVAVIDKELSERMASTIRHNRARGAHSVELMSNIVSELVQSGMSDAWIMQQWHTLALCLVLRSSVYRIVYLSG